MSTTYTSQSTPINLTGEDNGEVNYQEVTSVSGEEGSYTFSTEIQRQTGTDSDGTAVFTTIGTKNQSGVINLNTNASDDEEKYLSTNNNVNGVSLKQGLLTASNNVNTQINANTTLSAHEKIKLKESLNVPVTTADLEDAINEGTDLINSISIEGRNFRKEYGSAKGYYYPEGLKSNKQDRIRFEQVYSEGTKITTALD